MNQNEAIALIERKLASHHMPTLTLDDLQELTGLSTEDLINSCWALAEAGKASYDMNSWPATITRLAGNAYD